MLVPHLTDRMTPSPASAQPEIAPPQRPATPVRAEPEPAPAGDTAALSTAQQPTQTEKGAATTKPPRWSRRLLKFGLWTLGGVLGSAALLAGIAWFGNC